MKKEIGFGKNVKAVSIDSLARALYFTYSSEPIAKTERKSPHMSVDYDKNGKIVGVEYIRVKSAKIKLAVQKAYKDVSRVIDSSIKKAVV